MSLVEEGLQFYIHNDKLMNNLGLEVTKVCLAALDINLVVI